MHIAPLLADSDVAFPVELTVRRWGSGSRRALLIHGICSSAQTWWEIADCLAAAGMAAVAPDLRGHGASPQASRYRALDYAADLLALGEGWDLVVGHSLGGLIAARSAQTPGFAQRMLLIDPVFEIPAEDFGDVTAANVSEALDPPSEARIRSEHPDWHPEHARLKAEAAVQASPHAVERTMHDNAPWDHSALAERLACPTTILGGDPTVFCMFEPALGERLATQNPLVRYRLVAGTGHSVHRDRPNAVIAATRELLDGN